MIRSSMHSLVLGGLLVLGTATAAAAQSPAVSPGALTSPAASPTASPCPSPAAAPSGGEGSLGAPPASSAPSSIPMASAAPSTAPVLGASPSAAASLVPASPSASLGTDPCAPAVVLEIKTTSSEPMAFDKDTLTAPAGTTIRVEYLNDSNVPHNITFFQGADATAPRIAGTEVDTGPGDLQVVEFTTPTEPGSYFFHCDVHPTLMTGTFEVTAAG